MDQLRKHGFAVIYVPYQAVVAAFNEIDFNVAFDEKNPDATYSIALQRLESLTETDKKTLRQALIKVSKQEVDQFMDTLKKRLERYVVRITLIPLFGTR